MGQHGQDTHYFLPVIRKKIEDLEKEDMYPFWQAIQNGADAVLVGHLMVKEVTGIYPASLSREMIGKYLRKKYHYNGLILTDDLKMRAIKFIYGADLAVRKAFEAGNDVIVFRFHQEEERRVINKIIHLVKEGKLKEGRINRSVKRILKYKAKYGVSDEIETEGIEIDEINQQIKEIRKRCGIE